MRIRIWMRMRSTTRTTTNKTMTVTMTTMRRQIARAAKWDEANGRTRQRDGEAFLWNVPASSPETHHVFTLPFHTESCCVVVRKSGAATGKRGK